MDAAKISRLKEEQQKAIAETEAKIGQFSKFRSDYKALQKRLKSLPDKLSHDVMVPFGKLAFMPGKIVHTNEILVLLGDNWFVERSAKQACEIASRRMKELDKNIQELKEQKGLLEPRLGITSEFQAQFEGKDDYQEIVEEYDEEKEKLWDEQHKQSLRRYHEKLREERTIANQQSHAKEKSDKDKRETSLLKTDADLWSRLDALEKQEEERDELNSALESEDSDDGSEKGSEKDSEATAFHRNVSASKEKRVSWGDLRNIDEEHKNRYDDDDDDDRGESDEDDADESSNEMENQHKPVVKTIRFSHTKTSETTAQTSDPEASTDIRTPADIYKLFSPKPILKKATDTTSKLHNSAIPNFSGDSLRSDLPYQAAERDVAGTKAEPEKPFTTSEDIATSRYKAFSGVVKENRTSSTSSSGPPSSTNQTQAPARRVSKFKAQRMGGPNQT